MQTHSFRSRGDRADELLVARGPQAASPAGDYVARTVLFKLCTSEQSQHISQGLTTGLERIAAMNATLLSDRIAAAGSRQAEFDCATPLPKGADADADLKSGGFLFSKRKKLMIAKLRVSKLFQERAAFPLETIALHEFLHFLDFDNFAVVKHNDTSLIYDRGLAQFDVVYSCAVSAFAVENAFFRGGAITLSNLQTNRMAETCQAAQVINGIVTVDAKVLSPSLTGRLECYLFDESRNRSSDEWPSLKAECSSK